jgi:hypothetical protein
MLLAHDGLSRWAKSAEMIPEQTFSIRYNFPANP